MRWPYLAIGMILSAGLFSSCGPSGGGAGGTHGKYTGPFDSHGNYREELADNPPSKGRPTTLPNDEPPPDSIPLPPGGSRPKEPLASNSKHKKGTSDEAATSKKSHPVEVASRSKSAASSSKSKHAETASRDKETLTKSKHSSATAETSTKSKHAATASTEESGTKSKHATASDDAPSKSKKKTETASTSKKSKSTKSHSSSSYTVKSGDSLERIARHNHTSVASLKQANGLSGEMIHPGKKLVIPRD